MIDPKHIFPDGHDHSITENFTHVMTKLFPMHSDGGVYVLHKAFEGMKIYKYVADNDGKLAIIHSVSKAIEQLPQIAELCKQAKVIMDAYPDCVAGHTIKKSLGYVDLDKLADIEATRAELRAWLESI